MTDRGEHFKIVSDFHGLVQLVARNLYSSADAFVRELVQNAHDAIRLRQQREPGHAGRIEILVRPDSREIVFRDNGLGMNRRDIRNFLSVIGSSGTAEARARLAELGAEEATSLIGHFGIGVLSAFLVAEHLEVRTRKAGAHSGLLWENDGEDGCWLRTVDVERVGTEVTLRVAPAHARFVDEGALAAAIVRYSDFIPFPILLNGTGPVNTMHAPWHRSEWAFAARREPELRQFIESRYADVPLEVIPVHLEEPVRARGTLFITHNRVPDFNSAGVVDVYVRRMFVRTADPDLLPTWAKFVRGVIDSPDLRPNSARENVQRDDEVFGKLREALGRLVLERLTRLAAEEPERMARLCKWHHFHLKGIAFFDDAFFDQVAELLFFDSNRGPVCLRDLLAHPGTIDPSGAATLYLVSAQGAAAPYYRMAEARDWVVLDAGRPLDEALLRKFAKRNPERVVLVALDGEEVEELFVPLGPDERDAYRTLERSVESTLRRRELGSFAVRVRRFDPVSLAAVALATPETEAEHQLEALAEAPWLTQELAELTRQVVRSRIRPLRLLLNAAHPLVQQLRSVDPSEPGVASVHVGLALSALLHSRKLLTERNVPLLHEHLLALVAESARGLAQQLLLPPGGAGGMH